MVYLTAFAYTNGNPNNAFRGVDSSGNVCGGSGYTTASFPYLYFTNPTNDISARSCVSFCPSYTESSNDVTRPFLASGQITYAKQYKTDGTGASGTAAAPATG